MTGQIAFARTIRALDADDFRRSKMGSFFAIVLLAAWIWWFFTPSVPQFSEIHNNAVLTWDTTSHRVSFPTLDNPLARIPGQAAQIRFAGRIIGARTAGGTWSQPSPVQLVFLDVPSTMKPPLPSQATIEIETARVSPASVVLRALK
jgi:hypothetical protein